MRHLTLAAVIVLAGCATPDPVPAPTSPPEAAAPTGRITLDFEMTEVHLVLKEIARQAGANIVYRGSWNTHVSVTVQDAPWRDVLESVAKSCDLEVSWDENIARVTSD